MAPRTFVSGYSLRSSSVRAVVPWLSTQHHSIVPSGVQAQSRKRPTREPCHASLTSNQCLPLVGREGLMVALALVLALALALVLALALSVQPQGLHRALRPQPSPRRPRASQMSKWCRHRLLRSARCRAVTTVVSSMLATVPRRWCCVAHAHHHVRRCRDDRTHASQESAQGPGCAAPVGTESGLASGVHIPALRWCLVWQVEEEDRLKRFWELEIRRVCEELRFSYYITVRATGCGSAWWRLRNAVALVSGDGDDVLEAVLFVQNSHGYQATRHHVRVASGIPERLRNTCYACPVHRTCAIFLAIKAEASPFGEVEQLVRQLTDLLELEDKDLLQHEMLLLMGNRFHVTVYHPYRALRVRYLPARLVSCLLTMCHRHSALCASSSCSCRRPVRVAACHNDRPL